MISRANGYKILFLAPLNGKSHWMYLQTFIEAILDRGHEVTCITSITFNGPKSENYTEVLIDPPLDLNVVSKDFKMIFLCFSCNLTECFNS